MFKNVASQKLSVFAFADAGHATLDAGEPVTGDAANISGQISLDDGVPAASNDVAPTEIDATDHPGMYRFDLTQAETNADKIEFTAKSSTAGVQVVALPSAVIYTRPQYFGDLTLQSDGEIHADATKLGGQAVGLSTDNRLQVDVAEWNDTPLATTNPLPNAAADAAGGLPISDAGGLDLDSKLANTNEITVARMGALTDWINGGRLDLLLDAIKAVTDNIPDSGALTSLATASALATAQADLDTITGIDGVTLATAQGNYAPAVAGDAMALTSGERTTLAAAVEAAIINEVDGTAVMQAIADLIAGDMTTGDLTVQAIASAVRDSILNRVLSGNHDTAGTVGKLIQDIYAAAAAVQAVTDNIPDSGAMSSIATAAALATLDTVADGIKAVTDLLPDSGALTSLATASALATVDANVDSLVAAVVTASGEPGQGAPPVSADLQTKINYLYKAFRNKKTQTASEFSLFDDAGTTVDQKSTLSDDGTTTTSGEVGSGP